MTDRTAILAELCKRTLAAIQVMDAHQPPELDSTLDPKSLHALNDRFNRDAIVEAREKHLQNWRAFLASPDLSIRKYFPLADERGWYTFSSEDGSISRNSAWKW